VILVDSSVWIEQARGRALRLSDLFEQDELVTCMPVVLEVLQGALDERIYRAVHSSMFALRVLDDPMPREVFLEAVQFIEREGVAA
jgi:predicted nucleic acid-binding protein